MQRFRACVHVIDCYCLGEGSESDGTAYRANREDGVRAVRWQDQAGQGCGEDGENPGITSVFLGRVGEHEAQGPSFHHS